MTKIGYMASLMALKVIQDDNIIKNIYFHVPFSRMAYNNQEFKGMAYDWLMKACPINDGWSHHDIQIDVFDDSQKELAIKQSTN